MDDDVAVAATTGVAQVFDLHALKAFAADRRVRKMLFKTDQLWSEIACYEPGQSTVMHTHPREEEAIFVLEGTANMSIDGREVVVPAGSIVKFPRNVLHDVRNLGPERCVIMFVKVNPRILRGPADGLFYVRRDPALRARWLTDLEGLAREFGLSRAEYEAIRDKDPKRLMDLGVHQYYVPQILRLFFGAAHNTNASAALECYKRAFPEETARALARQAALEGR